MPETFLTFDFNLNETLHEHTLLPVTSLNTTNQLVQLPTQTSDLTMTNHTCLSTENND